jgi:hypothetical protein
MRWFDLVCSFRRSGILDALAARGSRVDWVVNRLPFPMWNSILDLKIVWFFFSRHVACIERLQR